MFIVDTSSLIESLSKKVDPAWQDSRHEKFRTLSNQAKGKFGTRLICQILGNEGYETKEISDEGDLCFRKKGETEWCKAEVKTAACTVNGNAWSAWFNQIRPKQLGWHEVWLVAVHPNHVRVYRKAREDLISKRDSLSSTKCLSHKGTDDFIAVTIHNANENEWECRYNDSTYTSL